MFLDLREKIRAVKLNSTKNKPINMLIIKYVMSTWIEAKLTIRTTARLMIKNINEIIKSLRKTV